MGSFESLVFREVLGLGEYDGLVTILGLIAAAFVYFLAPALGYTTYNRGLLLGSMWVLIAKFGLSVFRSGVLFQAASDGLGDPHRPHGAVVAGPGEGRGG